MALESGTNQTTNSPLELPSGEEFDVVADGTIDGSVGAEEGVGILVGKGVG